MAYHHDISISCQLGFLPLKSLIARFPTLVYRKPSPRPLHSLFIGRSLSHACTLRIYRDLPRTCWLTLWPLPSIFHKFSQNWLCIFNFIYFYKWAELPFLFTFNFYKWDELPFLFNFNFCKWAELPFLLKPGCVRPYLKAFYARVSYPLHLRELKSLCLRHVCKQANYMYIWTHLSLIVEISKISGIAKIPDTRI